VSAAASAVQPSRRLLSQKHIPTPTQHSSRGAPINSSLHIYIHIDTYVHTYISGCIHSRRPSLANAAVKLCCELGYTHAPTRPA